MPITPIELRLDQTKRFRANILPGRSSDGVVTWSVDEIPAALQLTPRPPLEVDVKATTVGAILNRIFYLRATYVDMCSNKTAIYPIKTCMPVQDVEITNCPGFLKEGSSYKLEYTLTPTPCCDDRILWTTSDSSILTVTPDGNVIAVGEEHEEATVTITTVDGGKKDHCTIRIIMPVKPIKEVLENGVTRGFVSGVHCFAAITKNSKNVFIALNDHGGGGGDSIQIFTRDGLLVSGRYPWEHNHDTNTMLPLPMTKENGFLAGATLKTTGPLVFPTLINYSPELPPANVAIWNGATLAYSGCGNNNADLGVPEVVIKDTAGQSMEYFAIDQAPEHLLVFITGAGSFSITATWDEIKDYPYDP